MVPFFVGLQKESGDEICLYDPQGEAFGMDGLIVSIVPEVMGN